MLGVEKSIIFDITCMLCFKDLSYNKNTSKMKKLISCLLIIIAIQSKSQFLTIKQAEEIIGKTKSEASLKISSYGYKKKGSTVSDMLEFEKNYELGDMTLTIGINNGKINAISWTIHPVMLDQFRREVNAEGFLQRESEMSGWLPFINLKKELLLNFIDNTTTRNEVIIVLGKALQNDIIKYKNSNTNNQKKQEQNSSEQRSTEILQQAEFVGGIEAMWMFIYENLRYPDQARENEIEGSIKVHFTISKEGEVQDVRVDDKDTIGFNLENEAIRVISIMPKWKPAKGEQTHKFYSSDFSLSVKFRLNDKSIKSFTVEELKSEFNRLNKKLESSGGTQLQGVLGEYQEKAIRLKNQINVQLIKNPIDKELFETLEYKYATVINSMDVEIYKLKAENEKLSLHNKYR